MTCKEIANILQMYVDGFADESEVRLAEAHLTNCAACREEVMGWRSAAEALQTLRPEHAPAGFLERVMAQVASEPVPAALGPLPESALHHRPAHAARAAWTYGFSWGWAAAAVVMVGMGLTLWLGPEGSAAASAARGFLALLTRLLHG